MAGRVEGKVALITGAARGQGRSHALALAREGADIIAVDIGDQEIGHGLTRTATKADLDETVRQVEELDRRCLGIVADISQEDQITAAAQQAIAEFGRIDVLVANAALFDKPTPSWEISKERWDALISVDLTGTWLTTKAVAPHMVERGSGSIIIISSAAGLRAAPFLSSYGVAKWGVRGLMLTLANELGYSGVRANSIHPGTVDTPGVDAMMELMGVRREDAMPGFIDGQILKDYLQPSDTSAGVLFLASDESRFVTGLELAIDGGASAKA
jgi:SDR family mycofactocin-dependent oxidoreductase